MVGSRVRRAVCTVWRRLLEAAPIPSSGQSVYITCSRWRRFPAARASSLTRLAAFLSRHSFSSMVRIPTETRKPPSSHTRSASDRVTLSESAERLIPTLAPSREQNFPRSCTFSYKIGPCANESGAAPMNQADDSPPLAEWRGLEDL